MNASLGLRDFGRGLFVELQVLQALILRETRTRFGESQLGYLWALIQPLLLIVPMIWLFEAVGRQVPMGMGVVGFLATGLIPFQMFRSCATRVLVSVHSNRGLLFYPQVRPISLMTARTLLEGATWISVFSIILGGEALLLGVLPVDNLLEVMLGLLLTVGLGGALGAVLCSLYVRWEAVDRIAHPMIRPLFWVSGVFFSVDELPPRVAEYFLYNPLLHTITMVRGGWYSSYDSRLVDPWYPCAWIVVLSFCALLLERGIRGRERE
jgi:capsular polysaccharide transport system permease protein